ncbi:hypothetical protein KJ693_09145 [bacterium]|nr:hypothetical protein [bacterium]
MNKIPLFNRLDLHMQEVVHGVSIAFVLKVLGARFGFNVLLARMLGAEGAGIYFVERVFKKQERERKRRGFWGKFKFQQAVDK